MVKKTCSQKEIKDLIFEVSDPSTHIFFKSYKGPNIYGVRRERGWGGHMFTCSIVFKQQIYCSFLRIEVRGWGVGDWVGRHNCMILNIKTWSDKKVTLLALVPVL